jgi:energy-coupling factor transporter transmembrane protein EcfT
MADEDVEKELKRLEAKKKTLESPKAEAAPAEVGALQRLGGGAKDTLYSGLSKAKGKSGWAIVIGILVAVGYFLYGMATGFVGMFSAVPFYFQILIIGIILTILVGVGAKSGGAAAGVFFIFMILTFGAYYLTETPDGQHIMGKAEIGGVSVSEKLRPLTGPLNIVSQVFAGTYTSENNWNSDYAQSELGAVQDVGVVIVDVRPLRDTFFPDQELSVQGRLNAVSFPGSNITAGLEACHFNLEDNTCPNDGWTCVPSSLKVSVARNRLFTCSHANISNFEGDEEVYSVRLTTTAQNTTTIAGKQFVFADVDYLLALEPGTDPLDASHLNISQDSLKSWYRGDPSLTVGIGIAGDPEVLEAGADTPNNPALDYYLGVNVENPSSQTGMAKLPYELYMYVPTIFVVPSTGREDFSCSPMDMSSSETKSEFANLGGLKVPDVAMSKCIAKLPSDSLAPGIRLTAFKKIKVTKNELSGQTDATFFVLASLKYNYENEKTTSFTIKRI